MAQPINKKTLVTLKAAFAAFGVYFCMYGFRKPFTVASFENLSYFGVDYKILIIIAQAVGYFISKFIGIKFISELKPEKRIFYLFTFIVIAELALLGFAAVPAPYNIVFMFINGIPLGMIWGIVFSYIEGRKTTEIIGLFLCSSFVVSSGFTKSVGKFLMDTFNISEFWMPFSAGLVFIIPLLLFGFLLERIPKPSEEDILLKNKRQPLNKSERRELIKQFFIPILCIVLLYVSLTVLRDFRDNFNREIWDGLHYQFDSSIFTLTEIPIAVMVLLILSGMVKVKNNKKAFKYYHYILFAGILTVGFSTYLFQNGVISPFFWMVLSGFGMYICYIPFNGIYFDRMIAAFEIKGNVGFLIYVVDSFGYLGSVLILLYKNFGSAKTSWLNFYIHLNYIIVAIVLITSVIAFLSFRKRARPNSNINSESNQYINFDTSKI
jgi:MFS family permease